MNKLLNVVAYFLALFFFVSSSIAQTAEPLEIKLTAPKNLLVGERPNLQIEITNVSNKPIDLVRPLDGSWHHWRYPHISVEVYNDSGNTHPVSLAARCGNMNPILAEDIQRLNPGEKKGFYVGWAYCQHGFEKPGKYNITLSYDLRAPNIDAWIIPGRGSRGQISSEVVNRLKRIPKLLLNSEPLIINVHPVTTKMLEQMIVEHFCRRGSRFDFVREDLKLGRWRVLDIRQSSGYISCKVEFISNYEPPPRTEYVASGYWFEHGRYLFIPQAGRLRPRALDALPDDQRVSGFKLYLPDDSANIAKKHLVLKALGFSIREETADDGQLLMVYLHQQNPHEHLKQKLKDIVDKSQVIFLHYKKNTPIKTYSDSKAQYEIADTLRKKIPFSGPIAINHHIHGDIYPGLYVTFGGFSKIQTDSPAWLEIMKLPINAGYKLEAAMIVYAPAMDTKNITLDKCGRVVDKIINELHRLMLQFKKIGWKEQTKELAGKWAGEGWPDYPKISYEFKFGREIPDARGGLERTIEHWCEIKVWFKPETGAMDYLVCRERTYRRQGITACWRVRSTDADFKEQVLQIIDNALEPLDKCENELVTKQ